MGVVWAAAILVFVAAAPAPRPPGPPRARPPAGEILAAAVLPVAVRVLNMEIDPLRTHQDEFVTGYFSATRDFAHESLFAPIPDRFEWMASFPRPFFLLQRAFFLLFGESARTLRLSVQVYVVIAAAALFLLVEELLGRAAAWAAATLFGFMAIALYFETLGLSFVTSAAALTVFFLCATRAFRSGEMRAGALAGVTGGFCYLAYYGSYLAGPLLGAFAVLAALSGRRRTAGRTLLVATAGMLVVVAPFLAWDVASGDEYLRRFRQVALTTGTWSPYRRAVSAGASSASIVGRNLAASAEAFVRDGVGGSGGYTFGRLAPFDRFSLALLVGGAVAALVLGLRRRESRELLLVLAVVGAAFLAGVALTIPPPAYHRFTVAFPFLAILMAVPFALIARSRSLSAGMRLAIPAGLLVLYATFNEARFVEAIVRDRTSDDLLAVSLLRQRFGGRDPVMALARYSDLDRTLYFYEPPPRRPAARGFHRWLLRDLDTGRKYAYVTALPDRFRESFRRADPNGRMYRISWLYGIFAN